MSVTPEIKQEVARLREQLQKAGYAYYVLDDPIIEDAIYDRLYRQLQNLEAEYPQLITSDSPTQRVGDKPAAKFTSVKHNIPLYSLENAFNLEELEKWENAVKNYSKVLQINPKYPEATKKLNYALAQKLKSNRKTARKSAK